MLSIPKPEDPFTDVTATDFYYEPVLWTVQQNLPCCSVIQPLLSWEG